MTRRKNNKGQSNNVERDICQFYGTSINVKHIITEYSATDKIKATIIVSWNLGEALVPKKIPSGYYS